MPRTLRISIGVRQPASIRFGTSGPGHRLTSNQRATAEEVLAGVLDSALDGVALLDAIRNAAGRIVDFRWTRINPAGKKILGRKADSLIGRKLLTTFPDTAHGDLLEHLAEAVDNGKPSRHEREYTRDGERGWIEYSVAGIADGVAVTFRDVSARHRDAAALQAALAEARKAEQARTTFLTLMNHELRNPLNGIVCALDLLTGCAPPERNLFLDTARASARELNRVVTAILDIAGLDAGPVKPNAVPFDHPDDIRPASPETSLTKRILLVDPGEASGMVTAMMLARAGFEVETVACGLEALRVAKLRRFDAMVIDMALPDINGVMTVKALRRLPGPNGSAPIVAITEVGDVHDDQRSLAAGVTDLMVKPFRKSNLLERLERYVHAMVEA
jgi:PAS domain S-box-containing protein